MTTGLAAMAGFPLPDELAPTGGTALSAASTGGAAPSRVAALLRDAEFSALSKEPAPTRDSTQTGYAALGWLLGAALRCFAGMKGETLESSFLL